MEQQALMEKLASMEGPWLLSYDTESLHECDESPQGRAQLGLANRAVWCMQLSVPRASRTDKMKVVMELVRPGRSTALVG